MLVYLRCYVLVSCMSKLLHMLPEHPALLLTTHGRTMGCFRPLCYPSPEHLNKFRAALTDGLDALCVVRLNLMHYYPSPI